LAAAREEVAQVSIIITLIKPEHYAIERVAEVELFIPLMTMADACGKHAMNGRNAVYGYNALRSGKPEPHWQVIRQPTF
jgi:hypothetical protein